MLSSCPYLLFFFLFLLDVKSFFLHCVFLEFPASVQDIAFSVYSVPLSSACVICITLHLGLEVCGDAWNVCIKTDTIYSLHN